MGNILSRIQDIAKNEKITIGAIEHTIGATKGVLSRAINKGTDIQSKWIQSLVEKYPQYSAEWLLRGNGPMLRADTPLPQEPEYSQEPEPYDKIPPQDILCEISAIRQIIQTTQHQTDRALALLEQLLKSGEATPEP